MINKLFELFLNLIERIMERLTPMASLDNDTVIHLQTPSTPPPPTLTAGVDLKGHSDAWCGGTLDERKAMCALARKVCQEESLSTTLTQDLLLTIYGESGFNQWCINTRTFDYGVAQFSKMYYLKEYQMTPQDAVENPEQCIRIMARNFKAGRQSNWIAYHTRWQHLPGLRTLGVDIAAIPA